ncbi:MAG TPA: MoxR family ATPase [Trueperaceae bacterium]|nr:MoxR family ATPase [Trueperaceae bacterium]
MHSGAPDAPGAAGQGVKGGVEGFQEKFAALSRAIHGVILGQDRVVEDLLVAALARGHVLVEGAPGLGKTRLVRAFADATDLAFGRIQFTPDLMPADVTGTTVFIEGRGGGSFEFQRGPVFTNVLLADEINRATPKTQSALLEAMQERAVTASGTRFALEEPFLVLATQNPIEMEGTYPLPEAQLDRFLFKVLISRPDAGTLKRILQATTGPEPDAPEPVFSRQELLDLQAAVRAVPIADAALTFIVRLVEATHEHPLVRLGSSPRGAQAMTLAAKAYALAAGRPNVELEDVRRALLPALRHRLLLSFEAEVEGADPDAVLQEILKRIDRASG